MTAYELGLKLLSLPRHIKVYVPVPDSGKEFEKVEYKAMEEVPFGLGNMEKVVVLRGESYVEELNKSGKPQIVAQSVL